MQTSPSPAHSSSNLAPTANPSPPSGYPRLHLINWQQGVSSYWLPLSDASLALNLPFFDCNLASSIRPSAVLPSFYWFRHALYPQLGEEYLVLVRARQYLLLIHRQHAGAPHHIPCRRKGLSAHCYHILGHFFPRPCKLVAENWVLTDAPSPKRTMTTLWLPAVYRTAQ